MNWDIIEWKWDKAVASIKAKYADMTDDEIMQAEAKWEKLSAIMQEKYGYTREEADDKVAEIQNEVDKLD